MSGLPLRLRRKRRAAPRLGWRGLAAAALLFCAVPWGLALWLLRPEEEVRPHALHEVIVQYLKEHRSALAEQDGSYSLPHEQGTGSHLRHAGLGGQAPRSPLFDPLASDANMRVEIGATLIMDKTAVVEVLFFDRSGGMWPRIFVLSPERPPGAGLFPSRSAAGWKITGIGKRFDWRDGTGIRGTRI